MKRQAGFTLIELVMVIVILGILSAFALPRFADLGSDARAASIEGIAGAIRSASSIAHADFLVKGTNPVVLEGQDIDLVNEYPVVADTVATLGTDDIVAAAQIDTNDFGANAKFEVTASTATSLNIRVNGATTEANCAVTYAEAAANSAPVITVVTTGC